MRLRDARDVGVDVALLDGDARAHRLERHEVEVHGPHADRAAAGQRDARLAEARDEGAEHEDGGAHRADEVVRRLGRGDARGVEDEAPGAGRETATPMPARRRSIVRTSARSGTLSSVTGASVRSAAAIAGSAAFLAPLARDGALEPHGALDEEGVHEGGV